MPQSVTYICKHHNFTHKSILPCEWRESALILLRKLWYMFGTSPFWVMTGQKWFISNITWTNWKVQIFKSRKPLNEHSCQIKRVWCFEYFCFITFNTSSLSVVIMFESFDPVKMYIKMRVKYGKDTSFSFENILLRSSFLDSFKCFNNDFYIILFGKWMNEQNRLF